MPFPSKMFQLLWQHPAYSKKCPKYQLEKQIQTIKIHQNITFPEARKIAEAQNSTNHISYARIVGTQQPKPTSSVAVQTEPVSG